MVINTEQDGNVAHWDENNQEIVRQVEDGGYDGVILNDEYGSMYVAFEPTQIKSATGNQGAFDPNNPDIRFQRTGPTYKSDTEVAQYSKKSEEKRYALGGEELDPKSAVAKEALEILSDEGPAAASLFLEGKITKKNATELNFLIDNMWEIGELSNTDQHRVNIPQRQGAKGVHIPSYREESNQRVGEEVERLCARHG